MDMSDESVDEISDGIDGCYLNKDDLHSHRDADGISLEDDDEDIGLPRVLIVTHVPDTVFEGGEARVEFEALFEEFETAPTFQYLKMFRRARVAFRSAGSATRARVHLNECPLLGTTMKCYFAQPVERDESPNSSPYLKPPKPEKQFLISPPSSPPTGWESVNEKEPTINYELIEAITNLAPGEVHEVQPASESQPGIVVHVCEDPEGFKDRPQILRTRSPRSIP